MSIIIISVITLLILGGAFLAYLVGHCRHKYTPHKTPPIFVSRRCRWWLR